MLPRPRELSIDDFTEEGQFLINENDRTYWKHLSYKAIHIIAQLKGDSTTIPIDNKTIASILKETATLINENSDIPAKEEMIAIIEEPYDNTLENRTITTLD